MWVAMRIEHIREDHRVTRAMGQDSPGTDVGIEMAVEKPAVHIDEFVIGKIVLNIHHEDGVCHSARRFVCRCKEAIDRDPLAAEVAIGIGRGDFHRVHAVDLAHLIEFF